MKARLLVAAAGIPFLLLVLIWLPPVATAVLTALLSAVAAHELYTAVSRKEEQGLLWLCCAAAALVPLLVYLQTYLALAALAGLLLFGHFIKMILDYEKGKTLPFSALGTGLLSGVVIPLSFSCLVLLRTMEYGQALVMVPLVCAFASDSLALFAGMLFGKHKLAPRVSPKKTIEGSVGGFLGSVIGMVLFRLLAFSLSGYAMNWLLVILLGLLGSAMGQLGDLSFSVIKREYGIKDYGKLLPGHGGVLDRFDSVLFVAPVVTFLLQLF